MSEDAQYDHSSIEALDHPHRARAAEIVHYAREVIAKLEHYGPSIVPHLLDTDDNDGQRLREALDGWRGHPTSPPVPLPVALNLDEIENAATDLMGMISPKGAMEADDIVMAAVLPLVAEVRRLQAKLDLPCGSCHPCENWADETWRREGRKPPSVITWQDTQDELHRLRVVVAGFGGITPEQARRAVAAVERVRSVVDNASPYGPNYDAVRAALAADEEAEPGDEDEGVAHVTETYRQTVNGREQLGWQCVTCLTHEVVMDGPGMGKVVPPEHIARLEALAAEHVRAAADEEATP